MSKRARTIIGVWGCLAAGLFLLTTRTAEGAPKIVTFGSTTLGNFSADLTYTVKKAPPKLILSRTCSLTGPTTSSACGAVASSTKTTTTYHVGFTSLAGGSYSYTVTVVPTHGGGGGTGSTTFVVGKINPTCSVTGYSVPYDGDSHTATGSCTGVGGVVLSGLDLSGTTHTDAVASHSDSWTFTDSTGNYNDDSGSVTDEISEADPDCSSVSGYSVPYDGDEHTASGDCLGVDGVTPLSGLDLTGTAHTDAVASHSDPWTFTDSTGNYNDDSGSVTDEVSEADPDCSSITAYTDVPYDGDPHTATGSCTGVGAVDLSADLDLSQTTHTDAGTYNGDAWSFTDTTGNYNDDSGTVDDSISMVDPDCSSVTGYSVPYDGDEHTASGHCLGVDGVTPLSGLDLSGTAHTDAVASHSDPWTFTDSTGNYNDDSSSVTDEISKVDPNCTVTGYSVNHDGNSHTASGSCTGVNGETLIGLDLAGTTHTDVGNYTDSWTFTDSTGNYNDTGGQVSDSIAASGGGGGGGGGGGCVATRHDPHRVAGRWGTRPRLVNRLHPHRTAGLQGQTVRASRRVSQVLGPRLPGIYLDNC